MISQDLIEGAIKQWFKWRRRLFVRVVCVFVHELFLSINLENKFGANVSIMNLP